MSAEQDNITIEIEETIPEPTTEVALESVTEEVAPEPTTDVAEEVTTEPTTDVAEEVTTEPTTEVAQEPTTEVTTEVVPEPTTEVALESVAEEVVPEPTTEVTPESVAEEVVPEPTTEVTTEVTPESLAEEVVPEPNTEVTNESVAEEVVPEQVVLPLENTDFNPYKIEPFYLEVSNGYVTYFRFAPHEFIPSKEIKFAVILMNNNYHTVDVKNYVISNDEYKNWADDDEYIINLLAQKANLTRISDKEHASILAELFPKML